MKQLIAALLILLCVALILPTPAEAQGPVAAWMNMRAARYDAYTAQTYAMMGMAPAVTTYHYHALPPAAVQYRVSTSYVTPIRTYATVPEVTVYEGPAYYSATIVTYSQPMKALPVMVLDEKTFRAVTQGGSLPQATSNSSP